jgi:hypothetical protein
MPLQLWIGHDGGYFFVDTSLGVQVGQAFQNSDASWSVEVNDKYLSAPDLEGAKRLFVEKYDRAQVQVGPGSSADEEELEALSAGFSILDLTPLEKSIRRAKRTKK